MTRRMRYDRAGSQRSGTTLIREATDLAEYVEVIEIPRIELHWTDWIAWPDLLSQKVRAPRISGVYEVAYPDCDERLHIGKSNRLRRRICRDLVEPEGKHSAGRRIRQNEQVVYLLVRWATTDRPCAAEEELHRRHIARFGRLPKHTLST